MGRAFLDTLYQPAPAFRRPVGDTIVCRCEEVTAKQVRDTADLGCEGPNQMKAFLRCGMGPCQGRLCGLTVTELIAEQRKSTPAEVGYYRLRPPVKPITLAELASLPISESRAQGRGKVISVLGPRHSVAPLSCSSGPRASCSLMSLSEQDARGPEEHERHGVARSQR